MRGILLFLFGGTLLGTGLTAAPQPLFDDVSRKPSSDFAHASVLLAGDSIMARFPGDPARNIYGWGDEFRYYFKDDGANVLNSARGGTSTRTFWDNFEKHLVDKKWDFVFIQFGHNDGYKPGPAYVSVEDYKSYLKSYIEAVRLHGGEPILVTPPVRYLFVEGQFVEGTLKAYAEAMREVGESEGALVLDMYRRTLNLIISIGPERASALFSMHSRREGIYDHTHFSLKGAQALAYLLWDELCKDRSEPYELLRLALKEDKSCTR